MTVLALDCASCLVMTLVDGNGAPIADRRLPPDDRRHYRCFGCERKLQHEPDDS